MQSTKAQASPTQADIDVTPSRKSWRQVLPIHPATELFPLLGADELRELADDIEKHGLRESAALYNDPKLGPCLLDGRNRFDALELLGREIIRDGDPCPGIGLWNWVENGGEPFDPVAFVLSKNIHRRHLTAEQRRELIVKLLKAKPEATNLQIAKQVKADDKTVGKVRTELEGRSEIPNVKTRTDSKGRKQPAKKRTKAKASTAESETNGPRKAVAPGDEALFGFSACILELKRRISTHQPTRFPVVFGTADDPVKVGLVASLARPGGNMTGINFLSAELTAKRLELLRQLLPRADRIAILVNPAELGRTESTIAAAEAAGRTMGLQIQVFKADTSRQIETAFENMEHARPDALFIGTSPFLNVRNVQLAMLAAFHRVPGIHSEREYAEAGGLISYGANIADAVHQMGVYTGRILKGAKLAELPVVQS